MKRLVLLSNTCQHVYQRAGASCRRGCININLFVRQSGRCDAFVVHSVSLHKIPGTWLFHERNKALLGKSTFAVQPRLKPRLVC